MSSFTMLEVSSNKFATAFSTAILLIVAYLTTYLVRSRTKPFNVFATLGKKDDPDFYETMLDGYRKHRDVPYFIPQQPRRLILPTRYIDEVKSLPADRLSFEDEIYMRFAGHYSSLGTRNPILINSIKMDLTRSIGRVLEELQKESAFAIPDTLGPCHDWTEIPVYQKSLHIVALLSGRVFVGYPLCRNPEWVQTTINYTIHAFGVAQHLLKVPSFIRPVVAPFHPAVKTVRAHRETAMRLITPIINERIAAMRQDPNVVLPNDAIQFLIHNSGDKIDDVHTQALLQLNLSIAAIHTTSMNFTHLIYDLCAHPEIIQPLRDEIDSVLASDGGILVKQSMTKLKKMDSFLHESQRFSPPNCLSMERMAKVPLTLSDGLTIPAGTSIAFNPIGTNMDPEVHVDPLTFDAFRFSNLRNLPGNETRFQFVTTGVKSINFGHGVHACPGRFFASNELKVALTYVLQHYDFRFKEGEGRPRNVFMGHNIRPDQEAGVLFRRRGDV